MYERGEKTFGKSQVAGIRTCDNHIEDWGLGVHALSTPPMLHF